jgi:hypothetical protein
MALKMKIPTIKETMLPEDPDGEAMIAFRQATARDNQIRDTLVYGSQSRQLTNTGMEIRGGVAFSVRQEIECRLTMVNAIGIQDHTGKELFRFKNGKPDMTDDEFHNSWGKINPISLCDRFHRLCLELNPDWGWSTAPPEGEDDEEGNPQIPGVVEIG